MIVATAGHVDHGKTELVKALTGVDTDRTAEEKRRALTIDLGFAYADLGGERVGFVDVPGHERFIRNMLAGVAAVDHGLLVVAADDGPMPQTIEHLAILDLLGVATGAVALAKVDRVSAERLEAARDETAAVLTGTALEGAPVFPVAAPTGEGVDALREHLVEAARRTAARPAHGNFRLAVDRSFTLAGAGRIVTGTVFSGRTSVADELVVSPAGFPARVRDIRVDDRPAESARAGQRCALNLAGAELRRGEVGRGDWVLAPTAHAPTDRIDTRLTVLPGEARALKHWTPVHVHIGAAAATARVATLEGPEIAPGATGLAQLLLDRSVGAVHGDRFIVRDQSAQRTLGGGRVVDPFGVRRGRAKPWRLARLEAMDRSSAEEALTALLAEQPAGVELEAFATARNLTPGEAQALAESPDRVTVPHAGGRLVMDAEEWSRLRERVTQALADWHAEHPDSLGPTESQLAARLGERKASPATLAAVRALIEDGLVVREGFSLRLPEHRPRLAEADAALLERVTAELREAGRRPPVVTELAQRLEMDRETLRAFLDRAARLGHLVRIARNRYFLPATVDELAAIAVELADESEDGTFDAATYRDRSGIGRNLTIQVLEYFDRAGLTRFGADRRSVTAEARRL